VPLKLGVLGNRFHRGVSCVWFGYYGYRVIDAGGKGGTLRGSVFAKKGEGYRPVTIDHETGR